jgi:acyl-CoA reductase-like NAD-dependent aldehyde dehydrogenase
VEVKIGIQSVLRELVIETDASAGDVERDLAEALREPHGVFAVASRNGGRLLVPADKVAFIEFSGSESRRVGFGNIT